jgi:hypothetical protein
MFFSAISSRMNRTMASTTFAAPFGPRSAPDAASRRAPRAARISDQRHQHSGEKHEQHVRVIEKSMTSGPTCTGANCGRLQPYRTACSQ